jgi:RimJ/RimL family protein N-acetyltransferase
MIGDADARGRGLAQAATALLVQYAVAVLGLRHIDLEVFADNRPALAVYEACGFRPRERSGALLRMVWAG